MADTKKYLDFSGLQAYDEKLKAYIETKDAAVQTTAANDATTKANAAKTYAEEQAAAVQANLDKTQGDLDNLEALVGELPADSGVATVVAYVDKKTTGIATSDALTTLSNRVTTAEGAIDAIEADYLKAADKTELNNAITAEADRAKGVEGGLETRLAAVEADYLVEADKTELAGDIAENAAAIAAIKEDVDAFFADADMTESAKDTLKELQEYIASDESGASAMAASIKQNADDIDALEGRMTTVEGKVTTLEGEMDTAQSDIAALQAAVGDGGSVDDMIADAVDAEKTAREQAVAGVQAGVNQNATDITALEGRMDTAESDIDQLQEDIALKAAQTTVDGIGNRVTTAEGKITTLEGQAHTHANKAILDLITAELKASYDDAVTKAHTHANAAVLDGITSAKVTAWDNSLQSAKDYADSKFVVAENYITTSEIDALFQ